MSLGFDAVSQNAVSGTPHQATNFAIALIGTTGPALIFDYHAGDSIASGYTFARALAAYQIGSSGVLSLIATGTIRDAHYLNGVRTTLIEPSRSNWLLDSVNLASGNWTAGSSGGPAAPTATAGQTTDPAGTASAASRIVQPAVSIAGSYSVLSQNPSGQGSVVKAFSVWLKGALGDELFYINATPDGSAYTRVLAALTTAWAQYSVLTSTSNSIYAQLGTDRRDASEVATTANTLYAWTPQLEDGGYATSPIVNGTSTQVTRPADVLTYTVPGGSGQVGTLYEYFYDLAMAAWVEQVSALTTSSTYVPASGRAYARWCFALGTQSLATMRDLTTVSHLMTGAIVTAKNVVGANTPKTITGGMTPSAVVMRGGAKRPSGNATPSGIVVRADGKKLSGTLTPSGAVPRKASKSFTGALTPSGVVATLKSLTRSLSGALTTAGAISRSAGKSLAGTLTDAGAIRRATARTLTGSLTPTGTVATLKALSKALTGALSVAGVVVRAPTKVLTGALTSAGSVVRAGGKSLTGTITPAGVAVRSLARSLTGAITPAGAVVTLKSLTKLLSGMLGGTTGYTAVLTDSVARANSTTSAGTPTELGGAYTPVSGGNWGVVSNAIYNSGKSSGAILKTAASTADGAYAGDVTSPSWTTDTMALGFRYVDASNFLFARIYSGHVEMYSAIAGTFTLLTAMYGGSAIAFTPVSNTVYTLRIEFTGASVLVYINGTVYITATLTGTAAALTGTGTAMRVTGSGFNATVTNLNVYTLSVGGLSGVLTTLRSLGRVLTGALTPAAALARQSAKGLAGTITGSGAISRTATRSLAGSLAPSGAIVTLKSLSKLLSGALTSSGALARRGGKALVGSLTPSGAIRRAMARALAGSLTDTGSLKKGAGKALSGSLTPSGTVGSLKLLLRVLTAVLTPVGALTRKAGKAVAGALTPAASLRKATGKPLTGTLAPSGVASALRVVTQFLSGTVAPAGSISRATAKVVVGTMAATGALVRLVASGGRRLLALYRAIW